jgi:serine/threonine protein kinase
MIEKKSLFGINKKLFSREINLMMKLNHNNVLRYIDIKSTLDNYYLFFEFCNGGDLERLLDVFDGKLNEKWIRPVIRQIAVGLTYLYENNVIHRDLKLENILLHFPDFKETGFVSNEFLQNFDPETENFEVVIADLGLARELEEGENAGTF